MYSSMQQVKNIFFRQVVTKFIDKSKIPEEYWLEDPSGGTNGSSRSPMEAALLSTLSHDNIVTVLDVFDNDACVQVCSVQALLDLVTTTGQGQNKY